MQVVSLCPFCLIVLFVISLHHWKANPFFYPENKKPFKAIRKSLGARWGFRENKLYTLSLIDNTLYIYTCSQCCE